jgi:hypothetical protein
MNCPKVVVGETSNPTDRNVLRRNTTQHNEDVWRGVSKTPRANPGNKSDYWQDSSLHFTPHTIPDISCAAVWVTFSHSAGSREHKILMSLSQWSRDSSVGIVTMSWTIGVRFPARAGKFFLRHGLQTDSASYAKGTGGGSLGLQRLWREAGHSPPSSIGLDNAWSYTSTEIRHYGVALSYA